MSEESEKFTPGECNGCSKGSGDTGPNEDCPVHGRTAVEGPTSSCVACERYCQGIDQLTEEFGAELKRKEAQLAEAWTEIAQLTQALHDARIELERL